MPRHGVPAEARRGPCEVGERWSGSATKKVLARGSAQVATAEVLPHGHMKSRSGSVPESRKGAPVKFLARALRLVPCCEVPHPHLEMRVLRRPA